MEKSSNYPSNFLDLPIEIQQEIAAYLNTPALGFFAQSSKQILKNILPSLHNYQALFSLRVTAVENSTYVYQAHQLFACGENRSGQLGLGDYENRCMFNAVPWLPKQGKIQQVSGGENHTVVLTEDNRLWMCGANYYGQLGLENKGKHPTFTLVPWPKDRAKIQQIAVGGAHTIVLTQDNTLWGCGANFYSQLGLENKDNYFNFTAIPWPKERGKIRQVVTSKFYTVVLTDNNSLWMCGYSPYRYDHLGFKDNKNCFGFIAISWPEERGKILYVSAGQSHIIAVSENNMLWVFGRNYYGKLGCGDNEDRNTFTAIPWSEEQCWKSFRRKRGRIQHVALGNDCTLVLNDINTLWTCGRNYFGQLGFGGKNDRSILTYVQWLSERGKIQHVSAGASHTVVLTDIYTLWVCGNNESGQLGLGNTISCATFSPVNAKQLPQTMKQALILNNTLHQLIKFGISLTLKSNKHLYTLYSQHQRDEPEDQPVFKKMKL